MPLYKRHIDPFSDFYRLRYLIPRNAANTGTGSGGLIDTGGVNVGSGTSVNGYGRGTIASMITTVAPASGAGIDFDCPFSVAIIGAYTVVDANNVVRVIVGGNSGVPAAANSNALTSRGFGVEFSYQNLRTECRLFCHNGTTYSTSAYNGSTIADAMGITWVIISSNGNGTINLDASYKASNSFNSQESTPQPSRILTLAGGPTGLGGGGLGYIDIVAVNSSATAPSFSASARTQAHFLKYGL